MRGQIKDEVQELASKYLTQGNISVLSDHNGGKLRLTVDFNDTLDNEADLVETAIYKKYPGVTLYSFRQNT